MATIDYTKTDFDELKQGFIAYLKTKPEMVDADFAGSGWQYLLDCLSYNTAYQNYMLNCVANESFLDSAILYNNIVSRAKSFGYCPKSATSAKARIAIAWTQPQTEEIISDPMRRVERIELDIDNKLVATLDGNNFIFNFTDNYSVKRDESVFTNLPTFYLSDYVYNTETGLTVEKGIEIYEGDVTTYSFTVNGDIYKTGQRFIIPNKDIDLDSIKVYVQSSESDLYKVEYQRCTDISQVKYDSKVYYIQQTDDELYEIYFGDDILSYMPKVNNIISVEYNVTHGEKANGIKSFMPVNHIGYAYDYYGNDVSNEVTYRIIVIQPASNGSSKESEFSIKTNANLAYQIQNRSVTEYDWVHNVKKDFSIVDDLTVWGGENNNPPRYGKVFLCIKPTTGYKLETSQKQNIQEKVRKKCTLTQIPEVVDPEYLYLTLNTMITFDSTKSEYSLSEIKNIVKDKISEFLTTYVDKFNAMFNYSNFVTFLNSIDTGIISNDTDVNIKKIVTPTLYRLMSFDIKFNNAIAPFNLSTSYQKAIYTNVFEYYSRNCILAEKSMKSNILSMFQVGASSSNLSYIKDVGFIDYANGYIQLNNLFVTRFLSDSNEIIFNAKPVEKDIFVSKNNLITFLDSDVIVKGKLL